MTLTERLLKEMVQGIIGSSTSRPSTMVLSSAAHDRYLDIMFWTPRARRATGQVAPFEEVSLARLGRWVVRGWREARRRVREALLVLRRGYGSYDG